MSSLAMNHPTKRSMATKGVACAMMGTHEEHVALSDVAVTAVLRDLLAEVTVCQAYRNDERVNIEAVYTFPLPLDAVLLELHVEIGGRTLTGVVVEKQAAEEKYEDAVGAGDAAVMLQVIEPGLYTMNVGNLLPQEQVKITFTYAMVYRWAGDHLRFFLPTTIAPRFGESPHRPHQVPKASLTVENQFTLQVEVFGNLRDAQFVCPSHSVELARSADKVVISLHQARVVMDRDFILNIRAPQAARSFVQCGADGDGLAAVASFQPFFPGLQQPRPLNLAIVIDCSGSMEGDSMTQAKQALKGILDALLAHDRATLIAFGSTTSVFSDRLLSCNKANLTKARRFANQLDASMGGTEIGLALQAAYAAVNSSETADIFLVTDGEVSSWKDVVQHAKESGHRIFTVGVGSAVSEAFVRGLADASGGECELVAPREGMAGRVIRHFERMRAPRARRVDIHWPEGAHGLAPATLGAVFEGDTIVACASFDHASISGPVVLKVETEDGQVMRHELPLPAVPLSETARGLSTVARLAAAARTKELSDQAGLETALHYRLLSPWTHCLVIAERAEDEKAQDLPALRKVPHTLAAGWGGAGSVVARRGVYSLADSAPRFERNIRLFCRMESPVDYQDMPAMLRSMAEGLTPGPSLQASHTDIPKTFRQLIALIAADPGRLEARRARKLLEESGLEAEFRELFLHAAELGINASVIATIILAELLDGPLRQYLPDEAQAAALLLRDHAHEEAALIEEMGQRGTALLETTRYRAGRDILSDDGRGSLERFARFRDLLDHARHWVKQVVSTTGSRERNP